MGEVADAHRSASAKCLLQLEAPSLILWRMHPPCGGIDGRWRKIGIDGLNLSESLSGAVAVKKCAIRSSRIFEEAGLLIRRKVVSTNCVRVQERRVAGEIEGTSRQGIIKDADTAPDHRVA